jgi:hypothetical protein
MEIVMTLSKTRLSVLSGALAALGLSVWAASSHHARPPAPVRGNGASATSEATTARAEVAVAEMKTQEKVDRVNAVLDASAKPDLAALAREQSVGGNAAVGALLTELSLEKDEYQAIHKQYRELQERHTAMVVKNPKSAEVKQADEELDRLLAEMRGSSERIQKITSEAMTAYTADKMRELGIAQR